MSYCHLKELCARSLLPTPAPATGANRRPRREPAAAARTDSRGANRQPRGEPTADRSRRVGARPPLSAAPLRAFGARLGGRAVWPRVSVWLPNQSTLDWTLSAALVVCRFRRGRRRRRRRRATRTTGAHLERRRAGRRPSSAWASSPPLSPSASPTFEERPPCCRAEESQPSEPLFAGHSHRRMHRREQSDFSRVNNQASTPSASPSRW